MVSEAKLKDSGAGRAPASGCWFLMNAPRRAALVLAGEAILLVEGQERPLGQLPD